MLIRSLILAAAITGVAVAATERFEVVSIKPSPLGQRGKGIVTDPGRIRLFNLTVGELIQAAYAVQSFQVLMKNAPATRYEILATAPGHLSQVLDERYEAMLQAMLAERFGLRAHRESREMRVYVLELARGGEKLNKSQRPGLSTHSSPEHVTATGASMLDLCTYLSRRIALPVVNGTELAGLFDFDLDWVPGQGEGSVEPPDPNHPPVDPVSGPSLFTALQEQLGLRLAHRKAAVPVVVVDNWTAPEGN